MDGQGYNNDDKWVEERIAKLSPPPGWRPDTDKAFENVLKRGKPAALRPAVRLSMAAATLAMIGVVMVLLPWKALWTPEARESTASTQHSATPEPPTPQTPDTSTVTVPPPAATEPRQETRPSTPETSPAPQQQAPDITLQPRAPIRPKKLPRPIIAEIESHKEEVPSIAQGQEPQAPPSGTTLPVVVYKVQPRYTDEARQARIQGTVEVAVTIREDGTPKVESVVRGLGYGLDESTVTAVEQWRFTPGTKDGKPVAVMTHISVNFGLK